MILNENDEPVTAREKARLMVKDAIGTIAPEIFSDINPGAGYDENSLLTEREKTEISKHINIYISRIDNMLKKSKWGGRGKQ